MSATKDRNEWGVLLDVEGAYNGGATLTAADDGFLVQDEPWAPPRYVHHGERRGDRGPMNVGQKRVKKSGRFSDPTLVHEAAGAGVAYSASDRPSPHVGLRIAGFDATIDATAGSEKYDYTFGTGTSGAAELYAREEKLALQGIYADLAIILGEDDLVPVWELPLQGLLTSLPSEASVPSITYPGVEPPVAESIQLKFGNFASAVVRSFEFRLNREISPRIDKNQAGHAGFTPGARRPTLVAVIEAASLTGSPYHDAGGIDPYQLSELASDIALSLQVGSTQYKRWKLTAPAAQLVEDIEPEDDGANALWRLNWELNPTAAGAKDNVTATFD